MEVKKKEMEAKRAAAATKSAKVFYRVTVKVCQAASIGDVISRTIEPGLPGAAWLVC